MAKQDNLGESSMVHLHSLLLLSNKSGMCTYHLFGTVSKQIQKFKPNMPYSLIQILKRSCDVLLYTKKETNCVLFIR